MKTAANGISSPGRLTQGVTVMRFNAGDVVSAFSVEPPQDEQANPNILAFGRDEHGRCTRMPMATAAFQYRQPKHGSSIHTKGELGGFEAAHVPLILLLCQ